jgi:hypothetical protein
MKYNPNVISFFMLLFSGFAPNKIIFYLCINVLPLLYAVIRSMILFYIVSMPVTYKVTNRILGGVVGRIADGSGCPTRRGLILHTVVFELILYILMKFFYM